MKSLSTNLAKRRDEIKRAIFRLEKQYIRNSMPQYYYGYWDTDMHCLHNKNGEKADKLEDRLSEWGIYFD